MHSIKPVLLYYGAALPERSEGWIKIRCCFHQDSHASAVVNYERNAFKCFACEMSGDTYKIIMEKEGVNFVEAIKFAERISPEGSNSVQSKPSSGRKLPRKPRANLGRRSSVLGRDS